MLQKLVRVGDDIKVFVASKNRTLSALVIEKVLNEDTQLPNRVFKVKFRNKHTCKVIQINTEFKVVKGSYHIPKDLRKKTPIK
jgi:hypothetical protein